MNRLTDMTEEYTHTKRTGVGGGRYYYTHTVNAFFFACKFTLGSALRLVAVGSAAHPGAWPQSRLQECDHAP